MGDKYGMILKIFIVKLLQKKNITGIKEVRIICQLTDANLADRSIWNLVISKGW